MSDERVIRVEALTRVEGEGGLFLRFDGANVTDVRLEIYEPPRLFESLLRGRALEDVPDITARICGICPVAYQMSSIHALERALGVSVSPELQRLRRLLYCGEWIESHVLHMMLLHAPDFLGYESAIAMAADYRQEVETGLRLKKHGNELLELLGGRAVHPINVAVGGFYRLPRAEDAARLIPDFQWGLDAAERLTRWLATLDFPDFKRSYELVSLVHPDEYPMNEGQVTTSSGDVIDLDRYEEELPEHQVPHSTALHTIRRATGRPYFVGPLARVSLNRDRLSPRARRVADDIGLDATCRNPFKSLLARGLEVIHAYEEALSILSAYRPARPPRVKYEYRNGAGAAVTEAPRGMLYHRYEIGDDGLVRLAKIVPPTSQNQAQIEDDLRHYAPQLGDDDGRVTAGCEHLVRSYDPCISCSTHFLRVTIERTP